MRSKTWFGLAVLWLLGANQTLAVSTSVTLPIYYQQAVPAYTTCAERDSATINVSPLLPAATITSNMLTGIYVDDKAVIWVPGGGSATRSKGGPCIGNNMADVNLKAISTSSNNGAFTITLSDYTSTNNNGWNEIQFTGNQVVTYDVAAPLPPAVSDTNADEQVCARRYSDDGCEKYQTICWYQSAGCSDCSSRGSPQVSFGLANFNVKVEDTPIWHETAVGEPLALDMRFSNYADPATNQTFGPKWSCQWNSSVTVLHAQTNRMVFPSGSIVLFTQTVANVYVPPAALEGTLVKTNGIFRYAQLDGWTWDYAQSAANTNLYLLSAVRDAWSNTVSVTYTNNDRLFRVRQTVPDTGRYLEFAYSGTNSRAISVSTEPSAPTNAAFSYSSSGWLTNVVDMGGYSYGYEYADGYLTRVKKGAVDRMVVAYSALPSSWTTNGTYWVQLADADGFTNKYTWLQGLVQEDVARGNEQRVQFHAISTAGSRGRVLTGSMNAGVQQQYLYNSQGRVTWRQDRVGGWWGQTYNAQNRLLAYRDPLSNWSTNVYAANGVDLLYEIPPLGPVQRVFTYVPNKHAVATESNVLGRVVTNSYNALGLVTNTSDGRVTNAYFYNGEGRLAAHWRNGELMATNQYDAFGRLYWSRDAAGLETWRTYDGLNRPTVQLFNNDGQSSTNVIQYDCCAIAQIVDRDGNRWNYRYNDIGEKEWESNSAGLTNYYANGIHRQPLSASNALHWTTRQYTPEGWLKTVAYPTNRYYDPNYHAENFWYDGEGRLTKRQTVSGAYYNYRYDALGRLLSSEVPAYDAGQETTVVAMTNAYDALGRRWWWRDSRGLAVNVAYNALGQVLTNYYYPDASTEVWTYNKWGQVLTFKDRANNVVSNFYDGQGRLWRQADARLFNTYLVYTNADLVGVVSNDAGQVWRLAYDAEGRVRQIIHPDPAVVENFAYSPMGNVTQHVAGGIVRAMTYDGLGSRTSVRVDGLLVESNRYDGLGRALDSQNADGLAIANDWDSWGELMQRHWPGYRGEYFEYGARGLTNVYDRLGIPTRLARDPLGRITNLVDGATNAMIYAYRTNGFNDMQYYWDGGSRWTGWTYDLYGNTYSSQTASNTEWFVCDRLNQVTGIFDSAQTWTRFTYDANGNLKTVAPGANPAISISYDGVDRPTNLVDGVGTTRWVYDAMGRLRSEAGPFGTVVSNGYDGLGRLTHLSFAGRTWNYQYDALGRVTNVVAPEGIYRLGYLAQGGRKTSLAYPNGVAAKLDYDGGIRLTNLSYSAGGDGRLAIRYGYDADDRRTSEIWDVGRAMDYAYDGAHQLRGVSSTGRASDVAAYRYDNVGNPLGRTESGLGITNGFSGINRITSGTWTGGAVTVAGAVNYNAGTVTVNEAVASRSGLFYERTNVALAAGTNLVTAVYRGPAFTNAGMVATSIAIVVVGPTAYGHDANGNLWWDAALVYQYDVLKRLTNVYRYSPTTVPILANRYDGLGRRVEAIRNGTNTERYVYVPGTFLVLAVLDATNGVKEIFTHGPDLSGALGGAGGIGGILSQTTGTNTHYLHPDGVGNVVLTTDASGKTSSILQYTPFGRLLTREGTFASRFAFSGKEWEPSAGLYYYGYRWYSPGLGRWLSRDPLGEAADPLHNLYRFVGNNPLNAVDPDGRFVNMIVGAASSVGMGITIGLVTGEGYSLSDFAIDASAGAVGAGVVSKANKLYRIARLRQLAKARGLVNLGQKGYVETWRKAGSLERLAIKFDPAKSPNVMVGSKVPRFEYRVDAGKYWDPYTGRVGAKGAISHVPLEPFTPNSSFSIGAAIGAVTLPADSDEYDAVEAAIEALILPSIDEEENKTRPCK